MLGGFLSNLLPGRQLDVYWCLTYDLIEGFIALLASGRVVYISLNYPINTGIWRESYKFEILEDSSWIRAKCFSNRLRFHSTAVDELTIESSLCANKAISMIWELTWGSMDGFMIAFYNGGFIMKMQLELTNRWIRWRFPFWMFYGAFLKEAAISYTCRHCSN